MWLRLSAIVLAALAAALLAVSGLGVRAGLWPFQFGIALFSAVVVAGLAAAAAAIIALAIPRIRAGWIPRLLAALLLGAASALVPLEFLRQARALPPIHDITTDTERPPQFVAIVPLRAGAPNPPGYEGEKLAAIQKLAYPEIRPLELAAPPGEVFPRAAAAAQAMGWEVVAKDEKAGRIEAVATTRWFGFKDDVVIRIAPAGAGSRVDVRSKSRVGRSDVGANAKRIREFLTALSKKAYS